MMGCSGSGVVRWGVIWAIGVMLWGCARPAAVKEETAVTASSPLQPQWPWGVKHSASAVSRLLLILTPVVDKGRSHAGPREKKNMRILFANEHGCALQLGVAIAFNWTSRIVGETSSKANTTSGVFRLSARTL